MAVAWVASGTLLGSTGADITPVIPAHVANDLLLLHAAARSENNQIATPAGWTDLAQNNTASNWFNSWCWRRATAAGTTNPLCDFPLATGDKYAVVHVIRGADTAADPFFAISTNGGSTDPAPVPGFTTTAAEGFVCSVGLAADNLATAVTITTAGGTEAWTTRSYTTIATGNDAGRWFGDRAGFSGDIGAVSHDFNGAPLAWGILIAAISPPAAPSTSVVYTNRMPPLIAQ